MSEGTGARVRPAVFTGLLNRSESRWAETERTVSDLFSPCTPKSRDISVAIPADFRLASGQSLSGGVRGRIVGPHTGALIVAAGGISAGRAAADTPDQPGWWGWAIGDGAPVDTTRHRLLAVDWTPDLDVSDLLTITTADQARLLAILLDHLGEPVIDAFVGASYGGCVGLAFAELFPDRIGRLVVISAAHRAHPAATAWRGVQRRLLQFGIDADREAEAISLARELAMTTYRSAEEFDARFGANAAPEAAGGPYPVCDYLIARGAAYPGQTSARRWIALSDSLDRHAVQPERIRAVLTVVGFTSDRLVPVGDSRALAERAPNLDRFVEAPSLYGHDAFLKERAVIADVLSTALKGLQFSCSQEIAA
jgi:homoserine O-acetyltransferase